MRVLNEGDILQPKRSVSGIDYTLTRLELFRICKEEGFIQDQHDFDMKAVVELIDSEMKRWHEIDKDINFTEAETALDKIKQALAE